MSFLVNEENMSFFLKFWVHMFCFVKSLFYANLAEYFLLSEYIIPHINKKSIQICFLLSLDGSADVLSHETRPGEGVLKAPSRIYFATSQRLGLSSSYFMTFVSLPNVFIIEA